MGVEASWAIDATEETRPWWESRLCLGLAVLATMLPLLYPPIPPLVDLLGHMGRYRVELDLNHSQFLQQYYDYHWAAIGNLGVDLLIIPLGKLFGLEVAVKLTVLVIPPLTAIGFLWVAREVHGRIPPTTFFALPFIYGFPFLFGFVNFALSVALAMKVTVFLLLTLLAFTGCTSVESQRDPAADFSRITRFFVERRLSDNYHIADAIVAELQSRGFEASAGPLTMIPEDVQALVSYEDVWAWDFKSYLIQLNVAVSHPHTRRMLAAASYRQPSLITKEPPVVVHRVFSRILPTPVATGGH